MKTKPAKAANELPCPLDNDAQRILKHILSPLELYALQNGYQPFKYDFEGTTIPINQQVCKQLCSESRYKLSLFTKIIERINQSMKMGVPELREFLETPLQLQKLSPYLVNRLIGLHCENMFKVMELGRAYISNSRGFGKNAMKELDALFEKNHCLNLFN